MSNALEVRGVCKRFGRQQVLDEVSLKVPTGVVYGLIGENGAGKSTLIRGLLGYHRFNAGAATVLGIDPARQPLELRRRVGYVPDAPAFYEKLSVRKTAWYASGFYPDGYLAEFSRLASEFELPVETRVRDLSRGMKSKLALALAMAFTPDLLVLDEPTSGLDPLVRRKFLESMVETAAAGRTVFISSHQIQELERVTDQIAILHQGVIRFAGPLEDLKSRVQLLTISQRDPLLAMPLEVNSMDVLSRHCEGRTTTLMVRDLPADAVAQLTADPNLLEVHAIRPSLEELYVGFTRGAQRPSVARTVVPDVA